jgi:hypothetical protein
MRFSNNKKLRLERSRISSLNPTHRLQSVDWNSLKVGRHEQISGKYLIGRLHVDFVQTFGQVWRVQLVVANFHGSGEKLDVIHILCDKKGSLYTKFALKVKLMIEPAEEEQPPPQRGLFCPWRRDLASPLWKKRHFKRQHSERRQTVLK